MNQHVGASFTLERSGRRLLRRHPLRTRPRPPRLLRLSRNSARSKPPRPRLHPGVPLIESASATHEVDRPDSPLPSLRRPRNPITGSSPHPIEAIASLETHRVPFPSTKPKPSSVATPPPRVRVAPAPLPPLLPPDPPPRIQAVPRRQPVPPPGRRSAFTQVRDGESSPTSLSASTAVPKPPSPSGAANRDVIAHRETPLNPGSPASEPLTAAFSSPDRYVLRHTFPKPECPCLMP